MSDRTVRIKPQTHAKLKALAEEAGESMPQTLEKVVETFYRQRWLEELSRDYARLRADKKAWEEETRERALWDNALLDGLEEL